MISRCNQELLCRPTKMDWQNQQQEERLVRSLETSDITYSRLVGDQTLMFSSCVLVTISELESAETGIARTVTAPMMSVTYCHVMVLGGPGKALYGLVTYPSKSIGCLCQYLDAEPGLAVVMVTGRTSLSCR